VRKFLSPLLLAAWAFSAPAAEIHLEALDDDGRPVWARFEIRGEDGRLYQPPFSIRDRSARNRSGGKGWYLGSFHAKGRTTVEVPAGDYVVVVDRGPEFERFEGTITTDDETAGQMTIAPKRWIDMNELGYYSGDFHVHRSTEDVPDLMRSEGLNLAAVQTMWNKTNPWEGKRWPRIPYTEVEKDRYYTFLNAEDERGGGAWIFHGLLRPLPIDVPGRWHPSGLKFVREAQAQRYVRTSFPWIEVEKPIWWEAPVVMALAEPDSIGLLHNHLYSYGVLDNEAWGRPRDEKRYPGREGFVDYSLDLVYRYWNLGFETRASAGSASGVLPNPLGYNRIYVEIPDEPFGVEPFYRNLRQGNSFVTNGPMLFFDAWEGPGGEVRIAIEAAARAPIEKVEIVANGVVIETFAAPDGKTRLDTQVALRGGLYTWYAARVYVENDDTVRMAHSQPVFIPGAWNANSDAQYFIDWIDDLIARTEADEGRFTNAEERAEVLATYREARTVYERLR